MTVLISVKIAGENEHFPHIFVTQDSDKLVKYFETKYAPYKVEMCEAVWKSNFRRPTPSTRRALDNLTHCLISTQVRGHV